MLERGFALVRDEAGAPIKQAKTLADGAVISITFADDSRHAVIGDTPSQGAIAPSLQKTKQTQKKDVSKKDERKKDSGQTELF